MNEHEYSVDTLAIRAGGLRSPFNEHSEALKRLIEGDE